MFAYKLTRQVILLIIVFSLVALFSVYGQTEADCLLSFPHVLLQTNVAGSLALSLDNSVPVAGLQVRFTYDSTTGFRVTEANLTSRTEGFATPILSINAQNPEKVEVLILLYSLSGTTLIPGSGAILDFNYQLESDNLNFKESRVSFRETLLAGLNSEQLTVDSQNGTLLAQIPPLPTPSPAPIVPEPSNFWLFSGGLLSLCILWRKLIKTRYRL